MKREDREMLEALGKARGPEKARKMENELHQQARSNQRFKDNVVSDLVGLERRPERAGQGRRLAAPVGKDPFERHFATARAMSLQALMSAAHPDIPAPDSRWAVAAKNVLADRVDEDPRIRVFVRRLADQSVAGGGSIFVEPAARAAGIPESTGRRYLRELVLSVEGEWIMPLDQMLRLS